jgi:hypothetical protein
VILSVIDRVVQSFSIGRLIIVGLVTRILALFLLPPTPSFLAPDEGTYAFLALWVADSQNVDEFPAFGAGLYHTSKTLILPAAALVRLGLDELTSVRIVSIAFGLLSIYFFTRIIFLVLRIRSLQEVKNILSQRLVLLVLILFAFLPSHFIWSTLGLRESAANASLLASVFFLLRLREVELSRSKIPQAMLAISLPILTLTLSFGARRQTAFIFVVFFCLVILVMSRRRNVLSLTGVILLGTILGLGFSTTPSTKVSVQFAWVQVEQLAQANKVTYSPTPVIRRTDGTVAVCEKEGIRITTISGEFVCISNIFTKSQTSLLEIVKQAPVLTLDSLENKREGNRVGAQTALAETKCTSYSQLSIQNLTCNAKEFPYKATAFLLRPLPLIDSGSLSNNLASVENLIWILLLVSFVYFLRVSFQNRFRLEVVIPTTFFIVFFSSLAALYEGNLGTAFRHKSSILWSLLLVIAIGINSNWRKSEEEPQEDNPRYAS